MKDALTHIFERQHNLQKRLKAYPYGGDRQQFINTMTLAAIVELSEAAQATPWKPWKKTAKFDMENFREELIDVLHFLVNLFIAADMTADDVLELYNHKNNINHKRQDEGY